MSNEVYDIEVFPIKKSSKDNPKTKCEKIVILDFDQTLGSFSHLYYLWCCLEQIKDINKKEPQNLINELMELYPEFLRVGILVILEFLQYKKLKKECENVYLYTNNQCDIKFVDSIITYIHWKLGKSKLFDTIIYAFKINNRIIDTRRTTHKKTYKDLIQCSLISAETEICFIDDTHHNEMKNKKVYYLKPHYYTHSLTNLQILERLINSTIFTSWNESNKNQLGRFFQLNSLSFSPKTKDERELDKTVSKKLMYYIKEFFVV